MENYQRKDKYNSIVLIPTDFSEAATTQFTMEQNWQNPWATSICILHVVNNQTKSMLKKENLYHLDYVRPTEGV